MRRKPLLKRFSDAWSALVGSVNPTFSGAASNRLTLDWARAPMSADKELYGNIGKLKARARDLARNNAHAAQALRLYADNVAGPKGVGFQCRVMNNRKRMEQELNAAVEKAWRDWGRARTCTVNGRQSWADLQRWVMQAVPCDGEAIIRIVEHARPPYGISLQVLDSDLLDETFNRKAQDGFGEIRMSVEVDTLERPVAYHFLKEHPNDLQRRGDDNDVLRDRIPAEQIIHLYRTSRLGATRGVTWFAPILLNLRMLGAYQEAEVVAARISASKVAVITTDASAYGPPTNEDPNAQPRTVDFEPGSMWELLPGQDINSWSPDHPSTAYNDFVKGQLQSVSSGLGLAYASLSGDLQGTSYASGRTGLLQERDHYRAWQAWLIEQLHERVCERWLKWSGLFGTIPGAKVETIAEAIAWQPRGWEWVDPGKDVAASEKEVANGLNSRSRILAEKGMDFEEVLAELKAEKEMADEAGVEIAPGPAPAAPDDASDEEDNTADEPPAKKKKPA